MAVVMDGNRRFARSKELPSCAGHRFGERKVREVLEWMLEFSIPHVSIYALSIDNLSRSEEELGVLMQLFEKGFDDLAEDALIHGNSVKVKVAGELSLLPTSVQKAARRVEEATQQYDSYVLTVCLAYGGREEIQHAVNQSAATDLDFAQLMWTSHVPDVDLMIRTGGERRLSNFMLWKLAYAELYFVDIYWPLLSKMDIAKALMWYRSRNRRFGR